MRINKEGDKEESGETVGMEEARERSLFRTCKGQLSGESQPFFWLPVYQHKRNQCRHVTP